MSPAEIELGKREFQATWKAMFTRVLGWSTEQAEIWIENRASIWESSWFLHDSPVKEIVDVLIPADLRERCKRLVLVELVQRIEEVLMPQWDWHPDQNPNFDWDAARTKLEALLHEYRSTV